MKSKKWKQLVERLHLSRLLFVTGTGTGVGKTVVAAGLLRCLRESGMRPRPLKPVACGGLTGSWNEYPLQDDAFLLSAAVRGVFEARMVNPFFFNAPKAPTVAAALEGREVDETAVNSVLAEILASGEPAVVEGAGGLLVPMTDHLTFADWAASWGMSAVIVARAGLGTLNHTALTLEAAARRGIEVLAVVLNMSVRGDSLDVAESNRLEIARFCDVDIERVRILSHLGEEKVLSEHGASVDRELEAMRARGFRLDDNAIDTMRSGIARSIAAAEWWNTASVD